MKMFRHLSSVFAIATIAPLALAATLAATPAIAQADQLPNPDWVALLSDYEKNYWQAPTDAEHGDPRLQLRQVGHLKVNRHGRLVNL